MCLRIERDSKLRKSTEDIICYKVVACDEDDGCLRSPYQDVEVQIGKTYKSKMARTTYNEIHKGLHSFTTEDAARKLIRSLMVRSSYAYRIAECLIPKGATYYEGEFDYSFLYRPLVSVASDTLTYVKLLT
jgi:glycyl-tRNA synthetase alpha subunit